MAVRLRAFVRTREWRSRHDLLDGIGEGFVRPSFGPTQKTPSCAGRNVAIRTHAYSEGSAIAECFSDGCRRRVMRSRRASNSCPMHHTEEGSGQASDMRGVSRARSGRHIEPGQGRWRLCALHKGAPAQGCAKTYRPASRRRQRPSGDNQAVCVLRPTSDCSQRACRARSRHRS